MEVIVFDLCKCDHGCFRGENRRMAMTDIRLKNQMFELKLADADLTDDKQTFVQSGKNILCNAGKHHSDGRQYSLQYYVNGKFSTPFSTMSMVSSVLTTILCKW